MFNTNPLHGLFLIDEVQSLKRESGLRFRETKILSLEGKDIDSRTATLFFYGIPSLDHIVRITAYEAEHPERRKFDQDIQRKLFRPKVGRALISIRQEGLSVSINCGLGGTEPYLALLFDDQCYRVMRETSELTQLHPPQGHFSFLRNSSQERQLLSTLPDLSDLIRLDGATAERIQRGLPDFSSTLQRILCEECGEASEDRTLSLYLPKPSTPDTDSFLPDLILLRFLIDKNCTIKDFCIVGSETFFYEPYTLRAVNKDLGL